MIVLPAVLDLASLRGLYGDGCATPTDVMLAVAERMASCDPATFITKLDVDELVRQADELLKRAPRANSLPLWGIPFAVKDNIDVGGVPTTAACPAFAYTPAADAFVVSRLKAAGAIVIGKTNLDQFATGLNGTRSPYGIPRCVFDEAFISGGSSSGSGVAVAAGLCTFALGTDTAGSGRVPAALNNIVGIKPTPGRISTSGVVPACRTLDVVAIMACCVADGVTVRRIAEGYDANDAFSKVEPPLAIADRLRVGVLAKADRVFYGDEAAAVLYDAAVTALETIGAEAVEFDFAPFRDVALLLYSGPWVAERLAAIESFIDEHANDLHPSVRAIVEGARNYTAVDAFRGRYTLEALRRDTETTWSACDALLLPTAPTTYTVDAMLADPVGLNSNLGHYTNFANLLGLAAIAVPGGFKPNGLPFGVTLLGPPSSDDGLAPLADRLHRASLSGMGRAKARLADFDVGHQTSQGIMLAVVGAHMSGLPLNADLVSLGARFIRTVRTAADYRLFALPGTVPSKPGMVRDPGFAGPGISGEIWELTPAAFGRFVEGIPSPLGIGRIEMHDGSSAMGFVCQQWATIAAEDITAFGGWRAFLSRAP